MPGSYAPGPDETTYTLPYVLDSGKTHYAVRRDTGAQLTVNSATGTTLVLDGDTTALTFFFGVQYNTKAKLPKHLLKDDNGRYLSNVRQQLRFAEIVHGISGDYDIRIETDDRAALVHTVSHSTPEDGEDRVAILAQANETDITLEAVSPYPVAYESINWESEVNSYGR